MTPLALLVASLVAAPAPATPSAAATPAAMRPAAMRPAVGSSMGPGSAKDDDVEDVEEVTEVKTVTQGGSPAQAGHGSKGKPSLGIKVIFGRLHAALVHFPIAWLLLLLALDFMAFGLGREAWRQVGLYVALATALSFAAAITAGYLRADQLPKTSDTTSLVTAHRNLAWVTAGIFAAAQAVRLLRRNRLAGLWRWAYLGLMVAATAAVLWTGHRGGRLVYGTDFLPW